MTALLDALVERFETMEAYLNGLDAATGDGDHGATMLKGLRAAAADPDAAAKAFRRAAGGASGSLFAVLIEALEQDDHVAALAGAAEKITALGQAQPGDKTMLDALIPASGAASPLEAAMAAAIGRDTTKAMAARRGRAKHVEGAGVGHVDAGATSVAEMLDVAATIRMARR